ncbi:hypothetical protein EDB80DRAFT_874961 [Ilyonectria destructans]|nr:hypothetical protein EDB80DRAFT_874961 [Ilyonectria destructans]
MEAAQSLLRRVARSFYSSEQVVIVDLLTQRQILSLHELSLHLELPMRRIQAYCNELESARILELYVISDIPPLVPTHTTYTSLTHHSPNNSFIAHLHQVNTVNTYCFVNYLAAIHAIRWRLSTIRDETETPTSTDPEHYCERCEIVWSVLDLVDQDSPDGLLCPKCRKLTALLQKEDVSTRLFADLGFFELRLREVDQTKLPGSSFWAA